jgi:hypothetical protein
MQFDQKAARVHHATRRRGGKYSGRANTYSPEPTMIEWRDARLMVAIGQRKIRIAADF